MTTSLQALDLKWPWKGMNTETYATELDPAESPLIENAIVTPYECMPRNIGRHIGNYRAATTTGAVVHANTLHGITMVNTAYGSAVEEMHYYRDGTPNTAVYPPGYTPIVLPEGGTAYFNDGMSATSTSGSHNLLTLCPRGKSVSFDGMLWSSSVGVDGTYGLPNIVTWGGRKTGPDVQGTTAAIVTPGSITITLSAPIAQSMKNAVMLVDGSTWYQHRVVAHTAGSATLTLERPWGYGDPAVGNIAAGTIIALRQFSWPPLAPIGVSVVEVYQGRLFGGRARIKAGTATPSYYPNALVWSYPGNGSRWPDANYIILDEDNNDPIMGLANCSSGLLVFKRSSTGILTGTDESSFRYTLLDRGVGCVSDTSICELNGVIYWMSMIGVMAFDGRSIKDLSHPAPGKGVRRDISPPTTSVYPYTEPRVVSIAGCRDSIYVAMSGVTSTSTPMHWVYDIRSGAWSKFGYRTDSSSNARFFNRVGGRTYAITHLGIRDETDNFVPKRDNASLNYFSEDLGTRVDIMARPYGRDTARIQDAEVTHSCYWCDPGAPTPPPTIPTEPVETLPLPPEILKTTTPTWKMSISTDAGLYGTEGVSNVYRYDFGHDRAVRPYLTERLTGLENSREASAFKVVLTTATGELNANAGLINIRLYVRPTPTRHGRVIDY